MMARLTTLGAGLALLGCMVATARAAAVTVYTDKSEWENALSRAYLTEDFADDQLNASVSFVSTESGHINPSLGYYQDVLASESQNEPMTTWSFAPRISAFGGNWVLGGPGGSGNSLLVYIADSSLYVGAIPNSCDGGFWGFISDTPFTSVRLVGGSGNHQQNYRLDDMVYVPQPSRSDFDVDGDVDADDLNILTLCVTGPGVAYDPAALPALPLGCPLIPSVEGFIAADFDEDGDVDLSDFGVFQRCYSGENRPPGPNCTG